MTNLTNLTDTTNSTNSTNMTGKTDITSADGRGEGKIKIAVFGEILWDIFVGECDRRDDCGENNACEACGLSDVNIERTIGGAPFNFAAHSARLGADVTLISAVGDDKLGRDAVAAARGFGVRTDSIARVKSPTGYCRVTLTDGSPSYQLARGVAYDEIPLPQSPLADDALYFGTLAQRGEVSAKTLSALLDDVNSRFREVFFDVNIRGDNYSPAILDNSIRRSTILKLSREEAHVFSELGLDAGDSGDDLTADAELFSFCRKIARAYASLRLVMLTLDRDGAVVYDPAADTLLRSQTPSSKALSTVGAGDSFSACFLCNYMRRVPIGDCLSRATALSDFVVTRLGAVPDYDPAPYR